MTVDTASTAEFVVNQSTFYLTLLITIGSAGAIIYQVVSGLANKIKRSKEETEEAMKRYVDDKMRDLKDEFMSAADTIRKQQDYNDSNIKDLKERADYLYKRILDDFFKEIDPK